MISWELQEFCQRWLQKSREYHGHSIRDCFDKFFTLFVAYNRLYAELTLSLARKGRVRLKGNSIPDGRAAKLFVHEYLGTNHIWSSLQNDRVCMEAVETIEDLIDHQVFAIKLDRLGGQPRRQEDLRLLNALRSDNRYKTVEAVLDIIYSVRCNMFHGHKGFHEVQTQILIPVTILLEKITILLYEKLSNDQET